jgi:hypothetical protein
MIITYDDILKSGVPLSKIAKKCGLAHCKNWAVRGIPAKHQNTLIKLLSSKINKLRNNDVFDNDLKMGLPENGESAFINKDLPEFLALQKSLVNITKLQAVFTENYKPDFSRILPYKSPVVSTDDKQLIFENDEFESYVCPQTGEVFEFKKVGKRRHYLPSSDYILSERYMMQSLARQILPDFRVCHCMRSRVSGTADVQILKSVDHQKTFFGGLQVCGSVWVCPVCAPKISERRRDEVAQAFRKHKESGGFFSFCTRTVPHTANDSGKAIRDQFRLAQKSLKEDWSYKTLLNRFGVIGSIIAYEITVGVNGWHLHIHEIYFHSSEVLSPEFYPHFPPHFFDCLKEDFYFDFEERMYKLWSRAAVKAGFDLPSRSHGLQVQNGDFAESYIAKHGHEPLNSWAVDAEISKQHLKVSKKGLSPFDLLRQFRATGDQLYSHLFIDYAHFMKRQIQLRWSTGLKDLFDIKKIDDVELARLETDKCSVLGYLSYTDWQFICKHEYRGMILALARSGGLDAVNSFLNACIPDRVQCALPDSELDFC